ncbi:uncharacterized protein BX664DRAFT_321246 [Halteromyces radiatus]|uniref:uncharacterized protein n=1 Tax=Halteromyces radiatus TaxID=101107 RepID=UPI00221F749D|nr:uncharacterized protein BX664DRAFT_321246 [Halteromyces radiatus]KAI8099436.1 hypothetical protein BX664DRAFT_321246 [Halteromyces radiatus]
MSAYSTNRFGALLLGEEETEVDKLGNTKPSDKEDTRPVRPRRTHQPAMSPPSRRARGDHDTFETLHKEQHQPDDRERKGRDASRRHGIIPNERGRVFDRRSGEVGALGTKKKNEQSWGHLGQSQIDAYGDTPAPSDPAGEGNPESPAPEEESNVMTLDEYRKNHPAAKPSLPPPREANDGQEDPKWKDGIIVHRADADDYYSGKESTNKTRIRTKKEKVFIDIDPPRHQPTRGRGGRNDRSRGNTGRRGRGRGGGRNQHSVNLSDASAFPTLG